MKKYFILLIILALFSSNALAQYDVNLSQYRIVNLRNDSSVKVLAGVANIRYKANKGKVSMLALPNNSFKTISQYLPDNRKISKQTDRFNKYSKEQQKRILETEEVLSRTFIAEFDANMDVLKFCNKLLKENPNIETAEPYYVNYGCGMPNDPEVVNQSVLQYIKAFEAWDICEGDSTVLIGVGDTGFDTGHKDLTNQIAFNDKEIPFNGIDDDNNGYIDDYNGYNLAWIEDGGEDYYDDIYNQGIKHGLFVAGITGARVNNEFGIAGVGNKCKIVPIKLVEKGQQNAYLYAYQSMLYAAARGCKVLNCSWGSPKHFSVVNQSVVDYVIACDVAVVVSAGNIGDGISNIYCTFYPAGYYGVLGVGGTNPNDEADLSRYVLGPSTRILAQARDNLSLDGTIQIVNSGSGTSFASPVVAGVLGILRSYKPELSAQEAIELARVTADSVKGSGGFVPNRVNMYKALTTDANLIPSIILKEQYFEYKGIRFDYFDESIIDDSVYLILKLKNILGDAKNINFTITRLLYDNLQFAILDTTGIITEINHNDEYILKLRFKRYDTGTNLIAMYKFKMEGENKQGTIFNDYFNFYVQENRKLNTIENKKMLVTIADNGIFGYDRPITNITNGFGFIHKEYGDFMYVGNLITASGYDKFADTTFLMESKTTNPLTLSLLDNENNVNITTEYTFPTDTSSALKTKLTINYLNKNAGLSDFAIGHLFDWDINNSRYNKVGYFTEAIPDDLDKYTAAAEFATDISESVFVGSLVFINKNKYPNVYVIPQAAGSDGFTSKSQKIIGLTNGIIKQTADLTDIQYIIGLLYTNPITNGKPVECIICTGIGKTKNELANTLKECAKSELTGIISNDADNNWCNIRVVDDKLVIKIDFSNINTKNITLDVFDLRGETLLTTEISSANTIIPINSFPHSVYYVRLSTGKEIIVEKIVR